MSEPITSFLNHAVSSGKTPKSVKTLLVEKAVAQLQEYLKEPSSKFGHNLIDSAETLIRMAKKEKP